jgi:short-subunit dehydrogenase
MVAASQSWTPHIVPRVSRYWLSRRTRPIGPPDRSCEGHGRVALVTGASARIGLAWCELLAAKGFDIVPVARRSERLAALKQHLETKWSVSVSPLVADLSQPGEPEAISDELGRRGVTIDVLVNNAGYSVIGRFTDRTWPEKEDFLRTIALSTIELTHLLLPSMVERRWGRIINVASIAAVMSGSPWQVLYSAGKSMVHKFSEGLAAEYEPFGVHSTVSLPGTTDTDIFETTGTTAFAAGVGMQLAMMSPVAVARQGFAASMRGRRMVVHGRHHKLGAFILLHSPRRLRYAIAAFLAEKAALPAQVHQAPRPL